MDSKSRLLVKAMTWQFSGLITMTVIGYLISGSFNVGAVSYTHLTLPTSDLV